MRSTIAPEMSATVIPAKIAWKATKARCGIVAEYGATDPAELDRIQTELTESAPFEVLTASVENGYLFVGVVYDDGSIQAYVDQKYLPDTVAIRPALTDVE